MVVEYNTVNYEELISEIKTEPACEIRARILKL